PTKRLSHGDGSLLHVLRLLKTQLTCVMSKSCFARTGHILCDRLYRLSQEQDRSLAKSGRHSPLQRLVRSSTCCLLLICGLVGVDVTASEQQPVGRDIESRTECHCTFEGHCCVVLPSRN